jgi:hypothetical protein
MANRIQLQPRPKTKRLNEEKSAAAPSLARMMMEVNQVRIKKQYMFIST